MEEKMIQVPYEEFARLCRQDAVLEATRRYVARKSAQDGYIDDKVVMDLLDLDREDGAK